MHRMKTTELFYCFLQSILKALTALPNISAE